MLKRTKLLSLLTALLMSVSSFAAAGDMMVRMRAINVMPDEEGTAGGGNIRLQSESVPEIDFTYFLTDSLALELIAATTTHSVSLYQSALTVPLTATSNALDLGEVSLLPPTLTLQWHFDLGFIKPYVGAGVNYTFFYGEQPGQAISIEYDNSFGWAAQIGADMAIGEKMYLNIDVKRIALTTDVLVNGAIETEVDINPIVVGLGVGYRF